ncbi:MAG: ATP-binding protein [Bacteroidetes bacterium]|nr:ATP-binding protein [Bacteroidota bacterium]
MATEQKKSNPFRIHGVATGESFADRVAEVARLEAALTEPGSKLIVYGPRRMGKTSAVLRAIERVNKGGGYAFCADLSTASSAADMSNRILAAAGAVLGRTLRDFITDLVSRLKLSVTLTADPATGLVLPGLDLQARDWDAARQREALTDVLDALNLLAQKRKITIGIALDEFQEITTLGGEKAEWHLRGAIQRHEHLSYVLAGSRTRLIDRMTGEAGAFYKLADKMPFGPIDASVFAAWIDRRFRAGGLRTSGAGKEIVSSAGPRTRDVMQLARVCYDRARTLKHVTTKDIEAAMREIIAEENDLFHMQWRSLTPLQQNVLRAVAAGEAGLTTRQVMQRFSLGGTGSAANAAAALIEAGLLMRDDAYSGMRVSTPTGYAFDSPFFLAWVWWNALQDLGPTLAQQIREGPLRYDSGPR